MPSIRASRFAMPKGYQPIPAQPPATPQPVIEEDRFAPSPVMHSAMPLMAATGDAFQRQFYNTNGTLAQYRTLPVLSGGTA